MIDAFESVTVAPKAAVAAATSGMKGAVIVINPPY